MIYCSKGHQNSVGSRFCLQCGEQLVAPPMGTSIQPGITLDNRYLIIRQIGQGGFGRTYLAEDINRFREACVLKEFSPQVQTAYVVQKAEELFQREASVLYQLQHPQIPRFRELLHTNLDGKEYLFLVQDYIEGKTYSYLLNTRLQQGSRFTEMEVCLILEQILPVLEYIHSLGVIHRDISPDNIILRTADQLPVLIDFGGVKQVVATVASQYYQQGTVPTLLGKIGYAPPEQMQTGLVSPHSDLYALGVTVLVLLTGKPPQELLDTYNLSWQWRQEVSVSPLLGQVLDKMLAPVSSDRYQSARQVLLALNPHQPPKSATVAIPPPTHHPTPPDPQPQSWWTPVKVFLVTLALVGVGGLVWWAVSKKPQKPVVINPAPTSTSTPLSPYSPAEQQRKEKLETHRRELGINAKFYVDLVNQIFWQQNPSVKGRNLTNSQEDESLRVVWDQTASELLDKLSVLSVESLHQMGNYTTATRARWKAKVNKVYVGSRSLYDLGNAAFYYTFPDQRDKDLENQPLQQVWYAFVNDRLNAILSGSAWERIVFAQNAIRKTVSGTLQPGGGKVFIAGMAKDQDMEVKLVAPAQVLLSIYSPSGKITFLADSPEHNYSTELPEDGFYEFVVVSNASTPVDYQLSLSALSPKPLPTQTPTPEPTPTETPTGGV